MSPLQTNSLKQPARIAMVTGCLKLGGSTTCLINFAGELVRRGIPVDVTSFERENPMGADFQRWNIPVLCLDQRRMIFEDRMQKALRRLSEFKPTVVLANLGSVSFEVFRYLPPGIFRVGVIHSDDVRVYEMAEHYAGCLDSIAVVSKTIQRYLQKRDGCARVPIQYLPLGVPMPPDENAARIDPLRPLRILYIGRLDREQKRVHIFPQILEQLRMSGIPFHWTIAGEGPEKISLEHAMQSSPAQTISFTGKISYAQVPELLRAHDVFLLASDYEGLPLSLLEAMGTGLVPVISNLASGIPEVVDATTGFLVQVNDVAGYAKAIIHLHEHRDELAAKSAAARVRVKTEFSVEAMTDRWLSIFPKKIQAVGRWPERWKIQPPLPARHPVYFSPPVRVIRRLAAKFRS
jgi:glycosyltransferase involved in cell wall biosynthesis